MPNRRVDNRNPLRAVTRKRPVSVQISPVWPRLFPSRNLRPRKQLLQSTTSLTLRPRRPRMPIKLRLRLSCILKLKISWLSSLFPLLSRRRFGFGKRRFRQRSGDADQTRVGQVGSLAGHRTVLEARAKMLKSRRAQPPTQRRMIRRSRAIHQPRIKARAVCP